MVRHSKGRTGVAYLPKATATVIAANSFVTTNAAGDVIPAVAATTGTNITGVAIAAAAAGNTDKVSILTARELGTEFEVATTGAVAADVGKKIPLTDASTANRGGTGTALFIKAVISPTLIVAEIIV